MCTSFALKQLQKFEKCSPLFTVFRRNSNAIIPGTADCFIVLCLFRSSLNRVCLDHIRSIRFQFPTYLKLKREEHELEVANITFVLTGTGA